MRGLRTSSSALPQCTLVRTLKEKPSLNMLNSSSSVRAGNGGEDATLQHSKFDGLVLAQSHNRPAMHAGPPWAAIRPLRSSRRHRDG